MASSNSRNPLNHFSYSCLSLYYSCRWCWINKYLKKIKPDKKNEFFEIGIKYHEQVHNYHTGQNYDQEMLKIYTQKYTPDYRKQSEIEFSMFLKYKDEKLPIKLYGFIDGFIDGGICDLKTGSTKPDLKDNWQAILYSQIYFQSYGEYPIFIFNHWDIEKNKIKNLVYQSDEDQFNKLTENYILPFLKDLENPDQIKPDSLGFCAHQYNDCPFN